MRPYYEDNNVSLYAGDCLDVLAELPDASVDSVVTDPPYGLDFMGKHWDTGAVAFDTAVWGHCLRILKPGGHLLAFGGTRTWHRLAVAVEDAGFEIRDSIAWLYGSGFPKSLDVSKAIDKAAGAEREVIGVKRLGGNALMPTSEKGGTYGVGVGTVPAGDVPITAPATDDAQRWQGWGTALKPAFEPIVVARKPLSGTVAANVLAHGVGALNIDACRVPTNDNLGGGSSTRGHLMKDGWKRPWMDDPEAVAANAERSRASVAKSEELGRWPANVLLDPDTAAELDQQAPDVGNGWKKNYGELDYQGRQYDGGIFGGGGYRGGSTYADSGGASRFFPVFRYNPKAPTDQRPSVNGVAHPTVKPLELMRWLIRLVTPAGGTVLEPFAGSGTTAEACIHEHMRCIAIEREPDYLGLIVARLTKPMEIGFDFGEGA